MGIISAILSLPITVILILWILKMKKDDPFPKGTVLRTLLFGMLSTIVVSILSVGAGIINLIKLIGLDGINKLMTAAKSGNETAVKDIIDKLISGIDNSFGIMFIRTFLVVGLVEEIFKFLVMKSSVKRIKNRMCWLDVVFCGALAGLGFELYEDIMYSGNGLGVVLLRLLTPFHFVFGVLMGYLYGKAMFTKNKVWILLSVLAPALIHALFDTSVQMLHYNEDIFYITFAVTILLIAAFVFEVIMIRKWYKTKELDIDLLS